MERIHNPEMEQYALTHLSDLYNIRQQRQGIHLSTLIYCLTRSYFDITQYILPTEEEVMLFALGYGLQDVLTPQEAEAPVFEKDGITYSPDFTFAYVENLGSGKIGGMEYYDTALKYVEIKTTRMSSDKPELPETWIEYIMGGCYIRDITEYELVVLYMMGNWKPPFPKIYAETLKFDPHEILGNWYRIIHRKDVLLTSLQYKQPPIPKQWCKEWECKYCRYKIVCDAIEIGGTNNG